MSERLIWTFRHQLARLMVNAAVLVVMPPGRARSELSALLWTWRMKIEMTIAADKARSG